MSKAQEHLSSLGVTMEIAFNFIMENLNNPAAIFNVCRDVGVTNEMLSEIVGVNIETVREFWGFHGLNANALEPVIQDIPVQPVAPSLPTSFTTSRGLEYEIVAGTSGNDTFIHTGGYKVYLGMGGNDSFSVAPGVKPQDGIAWFVGGAGDDVYTISPFGFVVVMDLGGGNDTVYNYVFEYIGENWTIDSNWLVGEIFDNLGNSLAVYLGGNLSNPNDYIENFIIPSQGLNLTQDSALALLKSLPNWYGNFPSDTGDAIDSVAIDIIGVYQQYVDAGF